MNILLIAVNTEKSPYPVAPVGALCIAGAIKNHGHSLDFIDMNFERNPVSSVRKALSRKKYDAIGLSIRNLDNCFYLSPKTYYENTAEIIENIKKMTDSPAILGGSGFSIAPSSWMKKTQADYGIAGEGENAVVLLLKSIHEKSAPVINGLYIKGDETSSGNSTTDSINKLDTLPHPAHQLCNYKKYVKGGGFVSIQTKRGCPYKCIYCVYPHLEGTRYRLREPESVVDEIAKTIKEQNVHDFFFTDSVFNSPIDHCIEICKEIIKRKFKIHWMAYCNPLDFDSKIAEIFKRSGCVGVEFGMDAAIPKMIDAMGKPFNQDDIRQAMTATNQAGLPSAVHLLFGGPGEKISDIEETQKFLNICPAPNAVFASFGIRIYENTEIYQTALREGIIKKDTDIFTPVYYVSPELGKNPVEELDRIARQRYEWSSQLDWIKPVMKITQNIINFLGIKPQWKDVRNYGKYMRK